MSPRMAYAIVSGIIMPLWQLLLLAQIVVNSYWLFDIIHEYGSSTTWYSLCVVSEKKCRVTIQNMIYPDKIFNDLQIEPQQYIVIYMGYTSFVTRKNVA